MKGKKVATWLLLLFVAATLATQAIKSTAPAKENVLPDGKSAVVFHATTRCPSCRTMERCAQDVCAALDAEKDRRGIWRTFALNYESSANRSIVEKNGVATATILLVERQNGTTRRVCNLTEECWRFVGDDDAFREMLRREIDAFDRNSDDSEVAPSNESERNDEFELAPDENLFDDEN